MCGQQVEEALARGRLAMAAWRTYAGGERSITNIPEEMMEAGVKVMGRDEEMEMMMGAKERRCGSESVSERHGGEGLRRRRKGGGGSSETTEVSITSMESLDTATTSSREATKGTQDPLYWFGALPSPYVREAQREFRDGTLLLREQSERPFLFRPLCIYIY